MKKVICSLGCIFLLGAPVLQADGWISKKKNADQKKISAAKAEAPAQNENSNDESKKTPKINEVNPSVDDHGKQLKWRDLKSQERHVAMLQKKLDGERAQLGQMQSDFATMYQMDLKRVKSGDLDLEKVEPASDSKAE